MSSSARVLRATGAIAALLVDAVGLALGLWWLPIAVGAALALVRRPGWQSGLVGLGAWILVAGLVAANGPLLGAARVTAALAGLGAGFGPAILIIGALVAFAGPWLAGAAILALRAPGSWTPTR